MMITVEKSKTKTGVWKVLLNKKNVGEIRYNIDEVNYQYFPKGQKIGGEKFSSLADVIASLN